MLLDEGFRLCLSTHALICVFKKPITKIYAFPEAWTTLPTSVHHLQGPGAPQSLAGDIFLLGHHICYQRWPLFFGVPQSSPAWSGCLRGQQVRVRRVSTQTSFQNRGLNVIYIELLEQTLGAALCARRSCIPQLFFYESSSLSWPNTSLLWPHNWRYLMSHEKNICLYWITWLYLFGGLQF